MTFENKRTIEAFKSSLKTNKLFFVKAYQGTGENKHPLCYKDANGAVTTVQKIAVSDDAGKTVAWCTLAVARDILAKGTPDASKGLSVFDCVTNDGEVFADRIGYAGQTEVVMSL